MLNESEVVDSVLETVDSVLETVVSVLETVTVVDVLSKVLLEEMLGMLELEDHRLELVFQELKTSVRLGRPGWQLSSALAAERLSKTRPKAFGDSIIFKVEEIYPHSKLKTQTKDF